MTTDDLLGLGWDDDRAAWWASHAQDLPGTAARPGRVLRTHRVGFDVLTPEGREFVIHKARRRDPLAAPATGDWVAVTELADVDEPVIAEVLDRTTVLVRRDPADRAVPQVLAANADVVAVVQGSDRPVNAGRLQRQLAIAHGSGADVVVIVTKGDLPDVADVAEQMAAEAPGTTVHVTTAHTGDGIDTIRRLADERRTVVLVGESGAGKSSLINAVVGHAALAIGVVREGDSKGRHTTTRRELLPLDGGGAFLDTPGIRAIALWPDNHGLDGAFAEIAEAAERCRFGDCTHQSEPGCAVRAGIDDGAIDESRLEAWRQLSGEVEGTRAELRQAGWR